MNAEPRESMWRGHRIWTCPFCKYDSPLFTDVVSHIDLRHEGMAAQVIVEPSLLRFPNEVPVGEYPLISCVMPTKDRPTFVAQSLRCFVSQTYPNKELIIVSTGYDLTALMAESNIQNVRLVQPLVRGEDITVGEKRNIGASYSTGELIANWDDDEWQSPNRLYEQYKSMRDDVQLSGIGQPIFMDVETAELYWYSGPMPHSGYVSGSSMLYRKDLWLRIQFPAVTIGEDTAFLQEVDPRTVAHVSPGLNVSFVHSSNTVTKRIREAPYVLLKQRL